MNTNTAYLEALIGQGELQLLTGNPKGIDSFEEAAALDPLNPHLFYRQGLSLFEFGSEEGKEKTLLLAGKKFKQSTLLDPLFFAAWQAWGNTLAFLGKISGEHHYFKEAEEKYKRALAMERVVKADHLADLYWDYGVVWTYLADFSEEALDLNLALEAFQKASSYQEGLPPEFWKDYGAAALKLARHINDIRWHVNAISCFKHALTNDISCAQAWNYLADALRLLYEQTHDEDHFAQANECFASTTQLRPHDASLWLSWAQFLCRSARRLRDLKRMRLALEKSQRAYACNPSNPQILATWAEALAFIGDLSEKVDLLHEAENKIMEASEKDPDNPAIWLSYGMCLISCGHYFCDVDLFQQAIEKFQTGLSIDRTYTPLWQAMALSYFRIAEFEEDTGAMELALKFTTKALDLAPTPSAVFDYALAASRLGEMLHNQKWLEEGLIQFEKAIGTQKNAAYLHPEWLFHYACTLDSLGDFHDEEAYYLRAIEIFSHVLIVDPDFPHLHHHLGLAYAHLGDLLGELHHFYRAVHYYRLAARTDEDNEYLLFDWAVTLMHIAERTQDSLEAGQCYRDSEQKLMQAAAYGNTQAYYQLGCLYSLLNYPDTAMEFLERGDQHKALPPLEDILQDEWLDNLRSLSEFRDFVADLERRPNLQEG